MNIKHCTLWLILGLQLSCDTSIEPLDKETGIYSVYGALDMNDSTNYIRVRDMNVPFTSDSTEVLDAVVTLKNNGEVLDLKAVRKEYRGIYLHNFEVNGEIYPETEYTLTAKKHYGEEVSVSFISPTRPQVSLLTPNQNCYEPVTVQFSPTNKGTILYNLGFPVNGISYTTPEILSENENEPGKMTITFTPASELNFYGLSCFQMSNVNIQLYYKYYSEGLYETMNLNNLDSEQSLFQTTTKLGAFFEAPIFNIPIDTSKVCPQDCE